MGIFCEINLFKPSDGAYQPGQFVSGLIKYAVDEPTQFEKITTSLKGTGFINLEDGHLNRNGNDRTDKVYVDIDHIIQDEKAEVDTGSYEIKINFKIPFNLPSTTNIYRCLGRLNIKCIIKYYIRIKFERPGMFAFNKHFRKEITIISGGTVRLLREPVMYGEIKKLTRLFSNTNSAVNIKATIANSVIDIGGKIEVHYEVENNSHVIIKYVETKLIERYTFKPIRHDEIEEEVEVPYTDTKTTLINCNNTRSTSININVPSEIHSLENAKIITRQYFVRITAALPIPHRNAVLNIPVQIGAIDEITTSEECGCNNVTWTDDLNYDSPPPSYWEAMGEMNTENAHCCEDK